MTAENTDISPTESDASTNPPEAGSPGDAPKRKIKIGSQRDTTPKSKAKPTPPPIEVARPQAAPSVQAAEGTSTVASSVVPDEQQEEPAAAQPVSVPEVEPVEEVATAEAVESAPAVEAVAEPVEQSPAPPLPEEVSELGAAVEAAAPTVPEMSLEDEIEAALGDVSLDELLAGEAEERDEVASGAQLATETRLKGTVLKVDPENVFFALGGRNQGVAALRQFAENPEVGALLDVVVQRFNDDEGIYEVHVPGASAEVEDWGDIEEGLVVEARVTKTNSGGLECEIGHIRGFIPISQVAMYRVENAEEFVGQKLQCVVTEANPAKGNLVLSRRAVLEREQEANREATLQSLEVGQVHKGTVRKLMDFGAFCELAPGVDGLIHISQLSWDRVGHPSEVLSEGQQVEVRIEKVDPQTGKIGLSYRELQDNPWTKADRNYPSGAVVRGTVSRIAQFGAFVKLEPGVEGLVHISEIAHHRVTRVDSVLSEGEEVEVKVLEVDTDAQRISLSLKAVRAPLPEPTKADDADDTPDEPPRELAVPSRNKPLKGGVGKSSGGEQFGLKW